ncbi:ras suppressor protein 1, partial [Diaphorina citri]|uniref:Ras suppressor protein 1 n=1 Tax=Diaphorina citri TaxID=121845 RepID=A0A1S3DE23_DIACI
IKNPELELADKGLSSFEELPGLMNMLYITRITLSHNKLKEIPPGLANLVNLEILTLFNNQIETLPTSLSSLPKLRILNLGMNRLSSLPRGFGAFPVLEVLDLTYNNLNEQSLPGNFFMLETLRALYLGDNDFEVLPAEIGNLKNLQIVTKTANICLRSLASSAAPSTSPDPKKAILETFLPDMMEKNRGHIVGISSMAGIVGLPNLVPYCASKFAVRGLMEALAEELREDARNSKIKFTSIFPFMVDTGLCKNPKIK